MGDATNSTPIAMKKQLRKKGTVSSLLRAGEEKQQPRAGTPAAAAAAVSLLGASRPTSQVRSLGTPASAKHARVKELLQQGSSGSTGSFGVGGGRVSTPGAASAASKIKIKKKLSQVERS